ncbi:MAG TPA: response regulator [Bryobacteraceae bacterium]|jgi:DNA-binding NtrC family response regulator
MSPAPVERQTRILVVQNDPVLLGLVSGSLRPEGLAIIEAKSPTDALRLAPQEFQTIDLVIAEINSRPITGIEFMRRLTRKGVNVPVLFMSASRTMVNVIAGSLGQSAVIEEPFTGAQLRDSVNRCLSAQRDKDRDDYILSSAI